jgi:hypothetical protein
MPRVEIPKVEILRVNITRVHMSDCMWALSGRLMESPDLVSTLAIHFDASVEQMASLPAHSRGHRCGTVV